MNLSSFIIIAFYLLSADKADYDGDRLIFTGTFQVEHPIGILRGEKAILDHFPQKTDSKQDPELTLSEGVSIEVTQSNTPFSLNAQRAFCHLPPHSIFSLYQFQELQFFDDVQIRILDNILAKGGSAHYKTGSLYLYPAIPSTTCQLLRENNRIDAREIKFDLFKEELRCLDAKGCASPQNRHEKPLYFSAQILIWQQRTQRLNLERHVLIEQQDRFSLAGDYGQLTIQEPSKPQSFTLSGNVRFYSPSIQGKETFSLSDKIDYDIQAEKVIFSALAPRRVLFWQEGFSLSAPKIEISRDPITQKEIIEGKGDVHFTFDPKEQNIIEELIGQYL